MENAYTIYFEFPKGEEHLRDQSVHRRKNAIADLRELKHRV
jgi:hypothetical protein